MIADALESLDKAASSARSSRRAGQIRLRGANVRRRLLARKSGPRPGEAAAPGPLTLYAARYGCSRARSRVGGIMVRRSCGLGLGDGAGSASACPETRFARTLRGFGFFSIRVRAFGHVAEAVGKRNDPLMVNERVSRRGGRWRWPTPMCWCHRIRLRAAAQSSSPRSRERADGRDVPRALTMQTA